MTAPARSLRALAVALAASACAVRFDVHDHSPSADAGAGTAMGMIIPRSHPRLWWTADRLERARAWFQGPGWR